MARAPNADAGQTLGRRALNRALLESDARPAAADAAARDVRVAYPPGT